MDTKVLASFVLMLWPWLCHGQGADHAFGSLRDVVNDSLVSAQQCLEKEQFVCVSSILNSLEARRDLTSYESWQVANFQAFSYYLQGENGLATDAYRALLSHAGIPPEASATVWRLLAQLHQKSRRLPEALGAIDMSLALTDPSEPWLNKFRQRVVDSMAGLPQIEDADELTQVVLEAVDTVMKHHNCQLVLPVPPHFEEFTGESIVYYRADGADCKQALLELQSRGTTLEINYFPVLDPQPGPWRQRPRNFDLIHEVVE